MGIRKTLIVGIVGSLLAWPALAYDVVIDTFDTATNTTDLQSFFGVPDSGLDVGLTDVLGGSRAVAVLSGAVSPLVESGVIPGGQLDYMSIGTGTATITYDGEGGGFRNALACAQAIEVDYLEADSSAQGMGTGPLVMVVALNGIEVARAIDAPSGTLVYPITEFAGVDLLNLATIVLEFDGSGSDSADLRIDTIRAVGCEASPSPSPAMSPIALGFGSLLLVGLGWLGVARRRASL